MDVCWKRKAIKAETGRWSTHLARQNHGSVSSTVEGAKAISGSSISACGEAGNQANFRHQFDAAPPHLFDLKIVILCRLLRFLVCLKLTLPNLVLHILHDHTMSSLMHHLILY